VLVAAYGTRFAVSAARARSDDGPVFLGVRPEKLHLSDGGGAGVPAGHQSVTGVVSDSSYVGVSTQYLVRTAWGTELAVFAPNSGSSSQVPVGAEVAVHWAPQHAFLLPREPGEGDRTAPVLDTPDAVGVAP
jgi:spermidine/putrescine transport system ATP-binding protein